MEGFEIKGHNLSFYGLCKSCKDSKSDKELLTSSIIL
jgi:Fe2+ or Zn2+ uptake regulation protein